MYIINGIAYASEPTKDLKIKDVKLLHDYIMIITFSTGEHRLFDATLLFDKPAFIPLKNEEVLAHYSIEYGVITWCEGEIDIAPEYIYSNSYEYCEPTNDVII